MFHNIITAKKGLFNNIVTILGFGCVLKFTLLYCS